MSSPIRSFITANSYLLRGRLRFSTGRTGTILTASDGACFTVFREINIITGPDRPAEPGAVFEVWFTLKAMSGRANRAFSWLPIPFIVGLPGFRAKLWAGGKDGAYYGRYRWDTVADAEWYAASYAKQFMTRRSVPESVSYRITPAEDFVDDLSG